MCCCAVVLFGLIERCTVLFELYNYAMNILNCFLVLLCCATYTLCVKDFIFKHCFTPQTLRACREHAQSWGIDGVTRMCKLFAPDTCTLTNQTKFVSEKACQHMCVVPSQRKLVCSLMPKPGPCSKLNRTWFFDSRTGFCRSFGGQKCGTNPNAFSSCSVCSYRCSHSNAKAVCGLPHHTKPNAKKKPRRHQDEVEAKHQRLGPD
uniref:Pancreatic trypsin inhibitor n=1 Tax=Rhipicephalus appendiculatus TaxID=34631 RepID=A0A131Z3B9_RHIAP